MDCFHRYLPYAKKAKYVVNPIGVKIFRHLAETIFPPLETIYSHLIPIICGEAPVLTKH